MKKLCMLMVLCVALGAHAESESFAAIKHYADEKAGKLSYAENYLFQEILNQQSETCIHEANFLAISYKTYEMNAYEIVVKNNKINREYPETMSKAELYRVVYQELDRLEIGGFLEEYQFRLAAFKYCVR